MSEFYAGNYTVMNDAILSRMPAFWVASKGSEAGLCGLCQITTQYLYLHYNKPSVNNPDYLFSDKYLVQQRISKSFEELAFNVIELRNCFAHEFGTPAYAEFLNAVKTQRKSLFKMLVAIGCMPTVEDYNVIKGLSEKQGCPSTIDFLAELCDRIHPCNYKAIMKEIHNNETG